MTLKQSILVIENNDRLRQKLGLILQRAGYMVATMNLSDGVEKFVSCWPCDLIVLDINHSDIDGPNWVTEIQRQLPNLRVVFLANQRLAGDLLTSQEEPPFEVVVNPIDPVQILDCVTALLSPEFLSQDWPAIDAPAIVSLN